MGAAVEEALFALYGSAAGREYKARFRTLLFNLKDPRNPELRARVMRGSLTPAQLVRCGSNSKLQQQHVLRAHGIGRMCSVHCACCFRQADCGPGALQQSTAATLPFNGV